MLSPTAYLRRLHSAKHTRKSLPDKFTKIVVILGNNNPTTTHYLANLRLGLLQSQRPPILDLCVFTRNLVTFTATRVGELATLSLRKSFSTYLKLTAAMINERRNTGNYTCACYPLELEGTWDTAI